MRPEDEIPEEKQEEAAEPVTTAVPGDAVETGEERKPKNYWWLALSFLFLLLAGGGYYALTSMGKEAQKLVGGDSYNQLSANSAAYSGGALQKADNYFASDEEDPLAAGPNGAGAPDAEGRPGGTRGPAPAGGSVSAGFAAGGGEAAADDAGGQTGGAARPASFAGKLEARASGLAGLRGAGAAKTSSAFNPGGEQSAGGGAAVAGKPSIQRETGNAAPKKEGSGGVLSALKGAFRASFYGARIASHDSARHWLARTFDANADVNKAIEYDEKVKASLDRINPNSIPKFLREQDVSAAEARTLATPDVGKPKLDVDGTKEALKNDADYQSKKMMQDMASAAMNPLGNMVSAGTDRSGDTQDGDGKGVQGFADPEDAANYGQVQLDEYISVNGYGAECGCSMTAPCCCLKPNAATGNCPLYGPFLPNDPCGNYGAAPTGDFPTANT